MSGRTLRDRSSQPSYVLKLDIGEDDDNELLASVSDADDVGPPQEHLSQEQELQDGLSFAAPADDADQDDNQSVASTSTRGRTPRGRGRGTPARGRGRGARRGGRVQRAGSESSGSDFAPPSPSKSDGPAESSSEEGSDGGAYSSEQESMRAVSDAEGSVGDSDGDLTEVQRRRRALSSASGRSPRAELSRPAVIRTGSSSRRVSSKAEGDKGREDVRFYSEGNPPLIPHYSSFLTSPPSLRARSSIETTDVPQRPLSIEEVSGRVRLFTTTVLGMTPWDAWAGEGWRPNSCTDAEGSSGGKNGWEGVEKKWAGLKMLDAGQGTRYLPNPPSTPPTKILAGHLTPSSPQTEREFAPLVSSALASHGVRKPGCIFNPGGPVWSVDWCPMTEEQSEKRDWKLYLAVAAHSSLESDAPLGRTKPKDTPGSIQIWSVAPTANLKAKPQPTYVPAPASKNSARPKPPPPPKPATPGAPPKKRGRPRKNQDAPIRVHKPTAKSKQAAQKEGDEGDELAPSPEKAPSEDVDMQEPVTGPSDVVAEEPKAEKDADMEEAPPAPAPDVDTEASGPPPEPTSWPASDEWDMRMKLEMVVCFEGGMPSKLQWCPTGSSDPITPESSSSTPKLGVLAGTFEDGSVKIFAVPDPDLLPVTADSTQPGPAYVHLSPLTTLEVDDATMLCLDWGSDKILATGLSNGRIATWDVKSLIHSGEEDPLPLKLVQAHDSPVRSLTFARAPQTDASGSYRYDWEQHLVVSVAQGRLRVVDLRDNDGVSLQLKASRAPILYGTATSLQNGSVVAADSDFAVYMSGLRPKALGSMRRAASHQGTVWDLATSDYHPNLASTSADGSLTVTNTLRGTTKNRAAWVSLQEIAYRMDKDGKTGEVRMLDNLLPQNLNIEKKFKSRSVAGTKTFSDKSLADLNARRLTSSAWAPEIGVLCASWNSTCGIGRAGLLASGMACGLARLDVMVDGRWKVAPGGSRTELVGVHRSKDVYV